jgi:hypothetical protein
MVTAVASGRRRRGTRRDATARSGESAARERRARDAAVMVAETLGDEEQCFLERWNPVGTGVLVPGLVGCQMGC